MIIYICIAIIAAIAVYVLLTYNSFVSIKNIVNEAFSTMDIYLKKRWDLIPNLVEVVKGYATHEETTLENVTKLRSESYSDLSNDKKIDLNEKLSDKLGKIMLVAENYPELKANENFLDLSKQLIQVEDEIANARKYYNGVVRKFNTKVVVFPSNLIANIFMFKEFKMFEAENEARKNVNINL